MSRLLNGKRLVVNLRDSICNKGRYLCVKDVMDENNLYFKTHTCSEEQKQSQGPNSSFDWIVKGFWVKGDFRICFSTRKHPDVYLCGNGYGSYSWKTHSDQSNKSVHWQLETDITTDCVSEPQRNRYRFGNVSTQKYLTEDCFWGTTTSWYVEIIQNI